MLAFDPERTSLTNFGVADPLTIAIEPLLRQVGHGLPISRAFSGRVYPAGAHAKREAHAHPAAVVSFGLFWSACSSPTIVCCPTLDYFFQLFKGAQLEATSGVCASIFITTQFVVSFGLAFELPLAVLLLVKLEILSYEVLQKTRAFAVIIILFLAAIITPTTDMLTLILMAGPMYLLYEGCILIAWLMDRRIRRQSLAANSTRG